MVLRIQNFRPHSKSLFILLLASFLFLPNVVQCQYLRHPGETFPIFKTLDEVLKIFKDERYRHPVIVDTVLDTYNNQCLKPDVTLPPGPLKPFIVLEGNDKICRENIGHHLAGLLKTEIIIVPPKCLANLTNYFEKGSILRRAFFGLAIYAVSHEVKKTLAANKTAIVVGYWSDQASFILCRRHQRPIDLPKIGSEIYKFPKDLHPPDMVFYINYPFDANNVKWSTHSPIWKPKKIQIYHRFEGMSMMEIDASDGTEAAAHSILANTKIHLRDKLPT